jgi:hypothetical protein
MRRLGACPPCRSRKVAVCSRVLLTRMLCSSSSIVQTLGSA